MSNFSNYLRVNKQVSKSVHKSEEKKAVERLKEMTKNYSLNSKDLHYANILYYLIINLNNKNQKLRQENKQLQEVIEEVREYAKNDMYYTLSDGNTSNYVIEKAEKELLQILDKGVKDE